MKKILNQTQQEVASLILDMFSRPEVTIIILTGLSGVGKSTLAQYVAEQNSKIKLVEAEEVGNGRGYKMPSVKKILFIASLMEIEFVEHALKEKNITDYKTIILKGMNELEIAVYVEAKEWQNAQIRKDEAIYYSMGIPLLVDQFIELKCSKYEAKQLAISHLMDSFRYARRGDYIEIVPQYLQVDVDSIVMDIPERRYYYTSLYALLPSILRDMREALKTEGFIHERPFFKSWQSKMIYDRIFAASNTYGYIRIYFVISDLSSDLMEEFKTIIGFEQIKESGGDAPEGLKIRPLMFAGSYRKAEFLFHENDVTTELNVLEGGSVIVSSEAKMRRSIPEEFSQYFEGKNSVFVYNHGHPEAASMIITFGWAIESWCQQKGICYAVENGFYEKSYIYNPTTNSIVYF